MFLIYGFIYFSTSMDKSMRSIIISLMLNMMVTNKETQKILW
jgi:hypothetical protein